jgi:hypothetical protein
MKKQFTLFLSCLALLISSQAQPNIAKFSDWYEPDTVYLFNTYAGYNGRHTFSYENGKCMFSIIDYDDPNMRNTKYTYTYDSFNNIKEMVTQFYYGGWIDAYKIIYVYDSRNNIIECVNQKWQGGWWENSTRTTYTYDAQNNILEQVFQLQIFLEDWLWYNYEKFISIYDTQNNLIEKLYQRWELWEDEQWGDSRKYTYVYNAQNNLSEELFQWWWWVSEQWEDFEKNLYGYDEQNNLIEKQKYEWNSVLEEWESPSKLIYTYDTQNNRIEELYQKNVSDEWKDDQKTSYTYDENHNANTVIFQTWENNAWIDYNVKLDLYYNNRKSMLHYDEWFYKLTATYIKPDEISIIENRAANVVKLYPNPTTGELTINNEQLTMNNIEIFDVYGRKVSSHHHIISSSHQYFPFTPRNLYCENRWRLPKGGKTIAN